jgi:arylsulfatase A
MDLLPTVAAMIGASLPTDRVIDGNDLGPILTGHAADFDGYEAFFFYRAGRLEAVRSGKWKLHVPHEFVTPAEVGHDGQPGKYDRRDVGLELYDLEEDPGETIDVSDRHPEVVGRLSGYVEKARAEIGDYITGSTGSLARPPARVEESWGQNPLPKPEDRVSTDPSKKE